MKKINISIDGTRISAPAGSTILEAATAAGIGIPTLCYLKDQAIKGNCRICLVEVTGARTLLPACATQIAEGMEIWNNNEKVRKARATSLQLLLSHHPIDCQSCVRLNSCQIEDLDPSICRSCFFCDCVKKDNDCELQQLVIEYGVNMLGFPWEQSTYPRDYSTASIVQDPNKCVVCRRCVESCGAGQGLYVWTVTGRGNNTRISTMMDRPLAETACVECGQCVRGCPVGALYETQNYDDILDARQDKTKTVTARVDPWFLEKYLKLAKLEPEKYGIGSLLAGLRRIGVDAFAANGEAEELTSGDMKVELASKPKKDLVISALCPASVTFVEKNYPELIGRLSQVPSPQQRFGKEVKAKPGGYTVSLSACSARKAEAAKQSNQGQIDLVLSPREVNRIFTRSGADPQQLSPLQFESNADKNFIRQEQAGKAGLVTSEITIDGKSYKAAAAYGLRAVRSLLEDIVSGKSTYDYVQLQACPTGCISTGSWLIG